MIDIKKLSVGQTVYEIKRAKHSFVMGYKWSHWPVYIRDVNLDEGYVIASWNGNPETKFRAKNGKFDWFKEKKA